MLKIGTRGSKLALWQAHHAQRELKEQGIESSLVIIKTKGDIVQHLSFDKIEGKGFFTKEIEDALLAKEIDLAVHSMKDLPTEMHDSLLIAGVSSRANPSDMLIMSKSSTESGRPLKIKSGASIGTSSIRRKVQLSQIDPTLNLVDIRGNVPTRIGKVRDGQVDGVLLAAAGVERLELPMDDFITLKFNPLEFVPAPAQGVVAYQTRKDDRITRQLVQKIHHKDVAGCTNIERKILRLLEGGCQLPMGAYCTHDNNGYHCVAALGSNPGKQVTKVNYSQSTSAGMAEHIVSLLKQL